MPAWVVWAYLAGAVLLVWPIAQFLLHGDGFSSPDDAEDRFWAAMFAVLAATIWPLLLGGAGAFYLSRKIWRSVLGDRILGTDSEGSRHA